MGRRGDRRKVNDRLHAGQGVPATQRLQRLSEIGDIGSQKRDLGLRMRRLRRWHEIDVQHAMAPLMKLANDNTPRLATTSGHGNRRHHTKVYPIGITRSITTATQASDAIEAADLSLIDQRTSASLSPTSLGPP